MALQNTVALTKTLLLPHNPVQIPSIPLRLNKSFKKIRLKCSFDSNSGLYEYEWFAGSGSGSGSGRQYPKPEEIQWKKELCNSVQLIGIVGSPVQIKHLPSGKVVAWSRLAVKKSPSETIWINLTLWDELAHVAFEHVEKGQQIYISGRLVSDTVESDDQKQQTYYKVVVQQLNFIEKSLSSISLYNGDSNSPTPGRKQNNYAANSTGSPEELWQAFFANPMEWWDNRKNKRSPNYPDFKNKDTGEALWVEGRHNPPWVKSQLALLDSRMESFHEPNSSKSVNFMTVDSLGHF